MLYHDAFDPSLSLTARYQEFPYFEADSRGGRSQEVLCRGCEAGATGRGTQSINYAVSSSIYSRGRQ